MQSDHVNDPPKIPMAWIHKQAAADHHQHNNQLSSQDLDDARDMKSMKDMHKVWLYDVAMRCSKQMLTSPSKI